jgi:hypothetical protein
MKYRWYVVKVVLSALVLNGMALPAGAASLWCSGPVQRVLLYGTGQVMIQGSWRVDWTALCNVDGSVGGIATEIFLSWHAAAIAARVNNKLVTVYYPEAGSSTCANLPTYNGAPVPGYFMMDGP